MYKEKFSKEVTERVVNPSCLKTMARNLNSEVRPMLGQSFFRSGSKILLANDRTKTEPELIPESGENQTFY